MDLRKQRRKQQYAAAAAEAASNAGLSSASSTARRASMRTVGMAKNNSIRSLRFHNLADNDDDCTIGNMSKWDYSVAGASFLAGDFAADDDDMTLQSELDESVYLNESSTVNNGGPRNRLLQCNSFLVEEEDEEKEKETPCVLRNHNSGYLETNFPEGFFEEQAAALKSNATRSRYTPSQRPTVVHEDSYCSRNSINSRVSRGQEDGPAKQLSTRSKRRYEEPVVEEQVSSRSMVSKKSSSSKEPIQKTSEEKFPSSFQKNSALLNAADDGSDTICTSSVSDGGSSNHSRRVDTPSTTNNKFPVNYPVHRDLGNSANAKSKKSFFSRMGGMLSMLNCKKTSGSQQDDLVRSFLEGASQ